jgi:hypothetical protein
MTTTSQLAADFLAITTNLDSMPEGVDVTLYRSFRRLVDGELAEVTFCARVTAHGCGMVPASQTIEADTAAECLLKLARLLP